MNIKSAPIWNYALPLVVMATLTLLIMFSLLAEPQPLRSAFADSVVGVTMER